MENCVVAILILGILGLAGWYILRAKKHGKKCIGCPDSGGCSGTCGSCQGCNKR